ncbi:MAG: alpha-mannosidase [Ruminococcaceae bacterium]|nr:alpha-mannosidase [Oscillospiraceae bacterium]
MKKIHLLCNAHLDPVWLWRWNEGVAEAISTFRVAADFCEQYDGFVFNHNEAVLYEWVEEHEPALFERIKKLVAEGKWKIFGGWYLQPDCNLTSGESILSQIKLGNDYFMEKFGVKPTTAMNLDPFGHSRGLVGILKLCGYDSYVFMRPLSYPDDFLWEGLDGSTILAHCIGRQGGYGNSKFGGAPAKIRSFIEREKDNVDIALVLWGVGNHGGGPSRQDLEGINEIINEYDIEILHSSAEDYIKEVNTEGLPVFSTPLGPCFPGCFTSMVRIKQANRRIENAIALTEKAMSYATIASGAEFDTDKLLEAKKALAFCQFHDILPGTMIKKGEDDSLRDLSYAEEILDRLYTKAFFKLCDGQKKAEEGTIPIMVFNPHPYEIESEFECGFILGGQNRNHDEFTVGKVYDEDGNALPTQNEKPDAYFELDWIKKVAFRGKLKPSGITRFDCKLTVIKNETPDKNAGYGDIITVCGKDMTVCISRKTGLIEKYEVGGKNYITSGGRIEVMADNEDPWGMTVTDFRDKVGEFVLMSDAAANEYTGYPDSGMPNVRVIEDGEVRTTVQAFFEYGRSTAVVEYTVPKNDSYVDVKISLVSNDVNKLIKYCIDSNISGKAYGDMAFGYGELAGEETENVFQKWCGIRSGDDALYVINNGTYAGSFTDSTIKLSLLRTPVYSAHPIDDYPICPNNRSYDHIDIGEREFSYRITTAKDIGRQAQIFAEAPRSLSFFPSGMGKKAEEAVSIDNDDIIMSSFVRDGDKYVLTLQNYSDSEKDAVISVASDPDNIKVHFGAFELKRIEIKA